MDRRDVALLFATRVLRLFAYGALSVVLVLHRGLHRSRATVLRLAGLFAVDAFAGGFIVQSFLRFSISQLDVPTRQSFTMAVVASDERAAAARGAAGVSRRADYPGGVGADPASRRDTASSSAASLQGLRSATAAPAASSSRSPLS